jgi:hypothetical protein
MSNNLKYRWQGGRLICSDGRSLSILQAYSLIPFSSVIRKACAGVLRDYKFKHDDIGRLRELHRPLAL